jgi:dTDP-4-dehydrorhamnose reductase
VSRILLIGKTGQIGRELECVLTPLHDVIAPDRAQLDLTNADSIQRVIAEVKPEIVINAAAYTQVDVAEKEPALAIQLNGIAPGIIAECAKKIDALLVHYSTLFVFDGVKHAPYLETDAPNPLGVYGRSKLAGDEAIIASGCSHIILRVNWIYSARRSNFVLTMLKLARERASLKIIVDQIGSPTPAAACADAMMGMLHKGRVLCDLTGIYNLAAQGQCTRLEWAQAVIDGAKTYSGKYDGWADLLPTTTAANPQPAARPLNTVADCGKIRRAMGIELPPWKTSIEELLHALYPASA